MIEQLPEHGDIRVKMRFHFVPKTLQGYRVGWWEWARVAQVYLVYSDGFRVWSDSCFVVGDGKYLGDPAAYSFRRPGEKPPPLHRPAYTMQGAK